MSNPASDKVMTSALEEIVFTDSIPFNKVCPKLKQLSVAPIFAEAIRRVLENESISDLYLIK
jgi:ribose-phosphate pyrophosphokinase